MADFPNSPILSRRALMAVAPAFALNVLPLSGVEPAAATSQARILTHQEEYDQFEAAMKLAFDPVAYVNYVTVTNDCYSIYRGEKRMRYGCWLTQFDQGNNCDRFLHELQRRGWAYQMLPGEKYWEAERRVEALRKRERIGVYAHLAFYDGPLRADDVTGTTAFANWERERLGAVQS